MPTESDERIHAEGLVSTRNGSAGLAKRLPVIVKTGAGQKRAQISLSYLLNKDLRKVEPNENEGNTHLPVVGW